MKSDSDDDDRASGGADALDTPGPIARAHLRDPSDTSHTMARLPAPEVLAGLVRWCWIPVWSVAPGREVVQEVLRYPVPLIVVTPSYARFYGVEPGLSRTTLAGDGWAFGLTLTTVLDGLGWSSIPSVADKRFELTMKLGSD